MYEARLIQPVQHFCLEGVGPQSRLVGHCQPLAQQVPEALQQIATTAGIQVVQDRDTGPESIVTLPKLKTHGLTLFTGGVKINFGCLPGLHKAQMHLRAQGTEYFSRMLVDLLRAIRPTLTVMDAVVGMDGDGPRNGRPRQIGAILASTDPVALDAVACALVGIEPPRVPTTRLAHEQGVGVGDLARIELLGEPLEAMRVADFQLPAGPELFFRATGLLRFLQGRLVAKPVSVAERCRGCWVCVEHCPADTAR